MARAKAAWGTPALGVLLVCGLHLLGTLCLRLDFDPDSPRLLAISTTLVRGQGFGTPYLDLSTRALPDRHLVWPPLYPLAVAGGMALGLSPAQAAQAVLVVCATAVVVLLAALGARAGGRPGAAFAVVLWGMWGPRQPPFQMASTEPLFVALMLGALLAALAGGAAEQRRRSAGWLALCGLLCGAATATRLVGIVLPLAVSLWLLRSLGPRRAVGLLLLLWLGWALPVFPWVVRNWLVVGSPLGAYHSGASGGALANLLPLPAVILQQFALPLAVLLLGWAGLARRSGRGPGAAPAQLDPAARSALSLLAWTAAAYLLGALLLTGSYSVDTVAGPRLLVPWGALLALLAGGVLAGSRVARGRWATVLLAAGWAGLLLGTVPPLLRNEKADCAHARILAHEPARQSLLRWLAASTRPGDLLVDEILPRDLALLSPAWVVEDLSPAGTPVTPAGVRALLDRFSGRLGGCYLLTELSPESSPAYEEARRRRYAAAGLESSLVAEMPGAERTFRVWRLVCPSAAAATRPDPPAR